jgi:hypothetical protein
LSRRASLITFGLAFEEIPHHFQVLSPNGQAEANRQSGISFGVETFGQAVNLVNLGRLAGRTKPIEQWAAIRWAWSRNGWVKTNMTPVTHCPENFCISFCWRIKRFGNLVVCENV